MFVRALLIVISPFTAFLPSIYSVYKVIKGRDIIHRNPWNEGLLALFIWSLIVSIMNRSIPSAILSLAFLLYFCLSIFIESQYDDESKVERLFELLIYFSIAAALFGLFEKLAFTYWSNPLWAKLLGVAPGPNGRHRIYSTFGNPNVAGGWFACMILCTIYFLDKVKGHKKTLFQAALILFIAAMCLTGSRGAALGLFFGLFAYVSLNKSKERFWLLILISFVIALVLFAPSHISAIKNLMGHELDSSIYSRQAIWDGCYKMFQLKPVTGWGLLGIYDYGVYFINYHLREVHGHNIWITLVTTLGMVGLTIYAYMKLYLFEGIRLLYSQNCRLVPLLAGIQALIIGHGVVDFAIVTPQMGFLFIMSSAFISSLTMQYNSSMVRNRIPAASYNSLI